MESYVVTATMCARSLPIRTHAGNSGPRYTSREPKTKRRRRGRYAALPRGDGLALRGGLHGIAQRPFDSLNVPERVLRVFETGERAKTIGFLHRALPPSKYQPRLETRPRYEFSRNLTHANRSLSSLEACAHDSDLLSVFRNSRRPSANKGVSSRRRLTQTPNFQRQAALPSLDEDFSKRSARACVL